MTRWFFHRISTGFKLTVFIMAFFGAFFALLYWGFQHINVFVFSEYGIRLTLKQLFVTANYQWPILVFAILILSIGIYCLDYFFFFKAIRLRMKESLQERKLDANFSELATFSHFSSLLTKLSQLFSFYKSLENMKTARIVLEMSTIKPLINAITEGVLFVNKEKVVTHINHVGERIFGLIPGEIIGETIIRMINDQPLMDAIDKALEFDQKIVDMSCEDVSARFSVFPIKDKFGDIIRVLIILNAVDSSKKISVAKG